MNNNPSTDCVARLHESKSRFERLASGLGASLVASLVATGVVSTRVDTTLLAASFSSILVAVVYSAAAVHTTSNDRCLLEDTACDPARELVNGVGTLTNVLASIVSLGVMAHLHRGGTGIWTILGAGALVQIVGLVVAAALVGWGTDAMTDKICADAERR